LEGLPDGSLDTAPGGHRQKDRPHEPRHIGATIVGGKPIFGAFAALAEFERDLIVERIKAGLASARARGRSGGRPYTMTAVKPRTAQAAMGRPETRVGALCREPGITRQTLYRHVGPKGELRPDGEKLPAVGHRAPACGGS
jgi:hypothetical protein